MTCKDLMKLKLVSKDEGCEIFLDDKRITYVEDYGIRQASLAGAATLSLTILVQYPSQENNS